MQVKYGLGFNLINDQLNTQLLRKSTFKYRAPYQPWGVKSNKNLSKKCHDTSLFIFEKNIKFLKNYQILKLQAQFNLNLIINRNVREA